MLKSSSLLGFVSANALAAFLLVGCATQSPKDEKSWYEAQRPFLKDRAEARWKARIEEDVKAEYAYLSPAYRSVVSVQQYKGRIGRDADWRMARVRDIGYDSPTVASVIVEVTYRIMVPGNAEMVESVHFATEKWLYIDGGWWYTAK